MVAMEAVEAGPVLELPAMPARAAMGYLGHGLISPQDEYFPTLITGEAFSRGLETTLSGRTFTLNGKSIQVTPVAIFLDKSDRYCREYEVLSRKDGRTNAARGVAFRNQSGEWRVWIFIASEPRESLTKPGKQTYVPAAGKDDQFNQILDQIMASPPLTPQQEQKIIRKGWKKSFSDHSSETRR
jgi:hypothetical protein